MTDTELRNIADALFARLIFCAETAFKQQFSDGRAEWAGRFEEVLFVVRLLENPPNDSQTKGAAKRKQKLKGDT